MTQEYSWVYGSLRNESKQRLRTCRLEQEEDEKYLLVSKNIFNITKFFHDAEIRFAF